MSRRPGGCSHWRNIQRRRYDVFVMKRTTSTSFLRLCVAACVAAVIAPGALALAAPVRAADCPDVDIAFARGTDEPPGLGGVGQAFVESVRQLAGGRSVGEYAVAYPANGDFNASIGAGVADARGHIESVAARCPNTRIVLGGYSQGAGVMDIVTNDMPPQVANHVAAVVDFGRPKSSYSRSLATNLAPNVGAAYSDRFLDVCIPTDPICWEGGSNPFAHMAYAATGQAAQAATFVVGKL